MKNLSREIKKRVDMSSVLPDQLRRCYGVQIWKTFAGFAEATIYRVDSAREMSCVKHPYESSTARIDLLVYLWARLSTRITVPIHDRSVCVLSRASFHL